MMKILSGHTSPETAYIVDDYPYGFCLRCRIRYWLEYSSKRGVRFMSQTTNPKRPGIIWNKPHASTYYRFGGCMFLGEQGHVQWSGLSEYCTAIDAAAWQERYSEGNHPEAQQLLHKWVAAKLAYAANRQPGDSLSTGLPEARKAFIQS